MSTIASRAQLIDYCLRRLGEPVIKVNVDEMQLEDRIDDAIQFFQEYHFDGVEQLYMPHQLTQEEIDQKYITIPPAVISITGVVPIASSKTAGFNPFDISYQMRLNELYNFSNMSIIHYDIMQQYMSLLRFEFNTNPRIQFNRHQQQLHLTVNWAQDMGAGDFLIMECYRTLDPNAYPAVWGDMFLKRYATALFKRQWGANLKKFQGVQLPGGVTLDGNAIYTEADTECQKIEEEMQLRFEGPPTFFMG